MKIGQLAMLSQLPASTIRFYEQKGLMPKVKRTAAGYREYDEAAVSRLNLIKFSQRLGFSLEEMPKLIESDSGWDHELVLSRLQQKYAEADDLITQLQQNQHQLATLIGRLQTVWQQGKCMDDKELAQIINASNQI